MTEPSTERPSEPPSERPSDPPSERPSAPPAISLEVYAHVVAALGEGYRLAEILEHEGISEDAWDDAEDHWVDRLDESAEGDMALHDELDRAVWRARQRFARPVAPLDTDVAAWLVLQHHASTSERPMATLAKHDLFLGDWVRLGEAWAERFSTDPDVRAAAERALPLLAETPLPEITPGPRVLPPPLFRPRPTVVDGDVLDIDPDDDDVPWGLAGIVPEGTVRGPIAARPPEPAAGPIHARPSYLREAPPLPTTTDVAVVPPPLAGAPAFVASTFATAPTTLPVPAPALASAADDDDDGPQLGEGVTMIGELSPLRGIDLPFLRESLAPSVPMGPRAPAPAAPPPEVTLDPDDVDDDDDQAGEGVTVIGQAFPLPGAALPFASSPRAQPVTVPPMTTPPVTQPPVTVPPMTTPPVTQDARPSPLRGADLPFRRPAALPQPAPSAAAPAQPAAAPAQPAVAQPAAPPAPGAPSVPFAPSPQPAQPAPSAPLPQLPEGAARSPTSNVPTLTLEQYAALCAELAMFPNAVEQTFSRYRLTSLRDRLSVDLAWRERLRRDPAENARWQALYAHYTAHWASHTRSR